MLPTEFILQQGASSAIIDQSIADLLQDLVFILEEGKKPVIKYLGHEINTILYDEQNSLYEPDLQNNEDNDGKVDVSAIDSSEENAQELEELNELLHNVLIFHQTGYSPHLLLFKIGNTRIEHIILKATIPIIPSAKRTIEFHYKRSRFPHRADIVQ